MKPPLQCPCCPGETMVSLVDRHTGLELDSCSRCFGLWFDGNELSALFPSRSLCNRLLQEQSANPQPAEVASGQRQCPRCDLRLSEGKVGEVVVDICRACRGIWFDHGEVQRIVADGRKGLRGDSEVVEQVALGQALEGISSLSGRAAPDPFGQLLDRLASRSI